MWRTFLFQKASQSMRDVVLGWVMAPLILASSLDVRAAELCGDGEGLVMGTDSICLSESGDRLRLGDFLIVQTRDFNRHKTWMDLPFELERLPRADQEVSISRQEIIDGVRATLSHENSGVRLCLQVPERVHIKRCGKVSAVYLINQLVLMLKKEGCASCILSAKAQKRLELMDLRVRPAYAEKITGDSLGFFDAQGKLMAQLKTQELSVMVSTLVAKKDLAYSEVLQEGSVELQVVEWPLSRLNQVFLQSLDWPQYQTQSAIRQGQVLLVSSLKRTDVVKLAQRVKAIVRSGPIEIEAQAIAKKSGARGDIIPVLLEKTQKVLSARIINDSEVELIQ